MTLRAVAILAARRAPLESKKHDFAAAAAVRAQAAQVVMPPRQPINPRGCARSLPDISAALARPDHVLSDGGDRVHPEYQRATIRDLLPEPPAASAQGPVPEPRQLLHGVDVLLRERLHLPAAHGLSPCCRLYATPFACRPSLGCRRQQGGRQRRVRAAPCEFQLRKLRRRQQQPARVRRSQGGRWQLECDAVEAEGLGAA